LDEKLIEKRNICINIHISITIYLVISGKVDKNNLIDIKRESMGCSNCIGTYLEGN